MAGREQHTMAVRDVFRYTLRRSTGHWRSWLARLHDTQEVTGSSPVWPTFTIRDERGETATAADLAPSLCENSVRRFRRSHATRSSCFWKPRIMSQRRRRERMPYAHGDLCLRRRDRFDSMNSSECCSVHGRNPAELAAADRCLSVLTGQAASIESLEPHERFSIRGEKRQPCAPNSSLSQVLKIGGMPVSLSLGGRYYAESPDGESGWACDSCSRCSFQNNRCVLSGTRGDQRRIASCESRQPGRSFRH